MSLSLGDLNSYLFILKRSNQLDKLNILDNIEVLIDAFLSLDNFSFNLQEKTFFSIEKSFELVYKFLKEYYPDKAYLFANLIDGNKNIFITSKNEQKEMNKLLYQRLTYYLKRYDLDTSVNLLEKELANSGITKNSYKNILDTIKKHARVKNILNISLLKHNINGDIKKLDCINLGSYIDYKNGYGVMKIENTNDVITVFSILHEYMHKDSIIVVKDDISSTKMIHNTAFSYLNELPSITMEMQLIDWLYQNSYITDSDYEYAIYFRLSNSFDKAIELRSIKMVIDIYRKNNMVNFNFINKELKKFKDKDIYSQLVDKMYFIDYLFDDMLKNENKITNDISYLLSTILSITILKRTKENPKYRTNFIEVNDNLVFLEYQEVLNILNLNYCNKEIKEELISNLLEYCQNYNNIKLIRKNKIKNHKRLTKR